MPESNHAPSGWLARLLVRPTLAAGGYVAAFAWKDASGAAGIRDKYLHGAAPAGTDPMAAGALAAAEYLRDEAVKAAVPEIRIIADPDVAGSYRSTAFYPAISMIPAEAEDNEISCPDPLDLPDRGKLAYMAFRQLDVFWDDMLHGRAGAGPMLPVPGRSMESLAEAAPRKIFEPGERADLLDAYRANRLFQARKILQAVGDREAAREAGKLDLAASTAWMRMARQLQDDIRSCMSAAYQHLVEASILRLDYPKYTVSIYRVIQYIERDQPEQAYALLARIIYNTELTPSSPVRRTLCMAACALAPLVEYPMPDFRQERKDGT